METRRLTGLVAILFSTAAAAQEPDLKAGLAKCAAIQGNLERLDCFDKLARAAPQAAGPQAAAPTVPEGSCKWKVTTSTNPVDDSKTVILRLVEDGDRAMLILRCMQGKPEVYINWANYLGSDPTPVLLRVGDAKADTKRWSLSTDNKATFYPGDDGAFIRQLLLVEKLVAQVTPYSESPVTAVFDVRGLSNAITPLQETCKLP